MLLFVKDFLLIVFNFFVILGFLGLFLAKKNLLVILMCFELILMGLNLGLAFFSIFLDDLLPFLFIFLILTVAAAESALGLAILVCYYRLKGIIFVEFISSIKC